MGHWLEREIASSLPSPVRVNSSLPSSAEVSPEFRSPEGLSQEPEAVEDSVVIPHNLDATVSEQETNNGDRTCVRNISIAPPSPDQNEGGPQRIRKPPARYGLWVHAQHISTDEICV